MKKQIKLKDRVIIIESCEKCIISDCEFLCDGVCGATPQKDGLCVVCPLEDAE